MTGAGSPKAAAPGDETTVAALDLGTNNCRLLVARASRGGYRVIDAFSRIVRLGEGLEATGRLSDGAMHRAISALKQCVRRIERRRVSQARSVATEACRRAANGVDFLNRVRHETGLELEIITPEEEAGLALKGCAPLLDPTKPYAVLFDIGGGSTEVLWITTAADGTPRLEDYLSLPVGVVTLSERHHGADLDPAAYAAIRDEFYGALETFDRRYRLAERAAAGQIQLLGTSGTVTTIASVHLDLCRYDRRQVDGVRIDFDIIKDAMRRLAAMSFSDRAAHPCIGRARADLVVPGCAVLEAICDRVPVGELTVADRGVRDGIVLTLMSGKGRVARARAKGRLR